MAEDIDIEEHDVLDNPSIKNIFPDISVLKKEISQFFDEVPMLKLESIPINTSLRHQVIFEDSDIDTTSNSIGNKQPKINKHVTPVSACDGIKSKGNPPEQQINEKEEQILHSNKIILGSKPNKVPQNKKVLYEERLKKNELKVLVKNIGPYLKRNRRYCKFCFILFSTQLAFNVHMRTAHSQKTISVNPIKSSKIPHTNKVKNVLNPKMLRRHKTFINIQNSETVKFTKPPKCNICNSMFSSKSNLLRHYRNIHSSKVKIIQTNTAVNNSVLSSLRNKCKVRKNIINNANHSCSHCKESFPNKKSLIEHMYSILKLKKKNMQNDSISSSDQKLSGKSHSKHAKIQTDVPKDKSTKQHNMNKHNNNNKKHKSKVKNTKAKLKCNKESIKNSSKRQIFNVYRCPICSYYFTATSYYLNHMIKKHKINQTATVKRVPFDSKCKYCLSKFDTMLSYNKHMYRCHKPQLDEIKSDNELCKSTENYDLAENQSSELHQPPLSRELDHFEKGTVKSDSFAFKSILFKCDKCDIHFLSASNAINHSQHMEILINTKCKTCRRIFKKNDELWHTTQHCSSDEFIAYTMRETINAKVLFKCSKCAIHLTEDSYVSHYPSCGIEAPNSEYCKICDILINHDNMESHKHCHTQNDYKSADFIIIESAIILDSVNEEVIHNNLTSEDENMSINAVKTKPSPVDKRRSSQNWGRKTWEELEEFENLGNTLLAKTSSNINDSNPNKSISSKAWSIFMLYMSYCNACKSFVSNIAATRKAHKQSLCAHIVKHVCKLCGLVLTNSAIRTHRNLHKTRNNLKLQDYKFFDMNGKQICPPIPEYPRCDICSVHFLDKVAVKGHSCSEVEHITCKICHVNFSEAAFNLHMSFHNYKLKKENNEKLESFTSQATDSIVQHHETKSHTQTEQRQNISPKSGLEYSMTKNAESSQRECTIKNKYFRCKSCSIVVDTYDKMIDHCHSHFSTSEYMTDIEKCNVCSFNFDKKDYEDHQKLHFQNEWDVSIVKVFNFDILYFTTENKIWVIHVFGSLPKEAQEILSKSIYQFEHRIKLKVTQSGPIDQCIHVCTVYKCDKCRSYVDPSSIFKHVENSCIAKLRKHPCPSCGLPFISATSRRDHEKIHARPNIGLKSYNIVTFNREEDTTINKNVLSSRNQYILYQCRNCDGIINKIQKEVHRNKCNKIFLSKCNECGLLILNEDYQTHASIHNDLHNFNEDCIKVILFGRKTKKDILKNNLLMPSFSGTILDYTFYKCFKCEICIDDKKSSERHTCLFGNSKSKCPKCPVHTSSNELHRHLKLHESELEFVRENMHFVIFNLNISKGNDPKANNTIEKLHFISDKENPSEEQHNETLQNVNESVKQANDNLKKTSHNDNIEKEINNDVENVNTENRKVVNLFKCLCGLHFLDELTGRVHSSHCNLKMKSSKQNCSKCDLLFTTSELFNHLINHHGDKNVTLTFNIIQLPHKYDKTAILYMCSKCSLHFIKPNEVNRHFKECEGAGSGNKKCIKCNFVYDNKSFDDNQHNEECQNDYKLTIIKSIPPGLYPEDSVDQKHNKSDDPALKANTTVEAGFKIRESFLKLDLRRYNNIVYKCMTCNIHWLNEDSMKKHLIICKLKKYTNLRHAVCKICGLNFSIQNVARHTYIHHEKLKLEANDIIVDDCIN